MFLGAGVVGAPCLDVTIFAVVAPASGLDQVWLDYFASLCRACSLAYICQWCGSCFTDFVGAIASMLLLLRLAEVLLLL